MNATSTTDRAPVYDLEAEKIVLGCLMLAPEDKSATTIAQLAERLTPDDFYNPRHADLYRTITDLSSTGQPTQRPAITAHLADNGHLNRLGGAIYLSDCCEAVPISASVGHYANRIAELAERRRLEAAGIRITQAATAPGATLDDITDLARELVNDIKPRRPGIDLVSIGSLLNPCLDAIEARSDDTTGITTGIIDLDRLLEGFRPGQLVAVSGATGMGKSVLLADIARHASIKSGFTVAWFSLEMSKQGVFDRVLSAESKVPLHTIRKGKLGDQDWAQISTRLGPLSTAPLFISDRAPMTVPDMIRQCQRLRAQHGRLDLVVVDHMHIAETSIRGADERTRMEDISRRLKVDMAMGLDIPVLSAAQLNRNYAGRADKRPELSDLRSSSAIEQACDIVILVHREDYYDKESPRAGEADLIVAKHRDGPTDTVTVAAQLHLSRFVDMAVV